MECGDFGGVACGAVTHIRVAVQTAAIKSSDVVVVDVLLGV